MVPDAAAALLQLHARVDELGGTLFVSDCYRSPEVQGKARKKYERWLAAGKPSPRSAEYDKTTMKGAFVSRPGRSNHNAGRAVDLDHMHAAPDDVPRNEKLDWLWDVAIPLGWKPIIKSPREGQSEAWHFDFLGPWQVVRDRLDYGQTAMCGVLDHGGGEDLYDRAWERWVQAQIHRAGPDIGDVDGWFGRMTKAGADALGIEYLFAPKYTHHRVFLPAEREALEAALIALPSVGTSVA
tara:strand:- start:16 stop:732 length:717 start_codon:yes stop_codon:yes gene_type:complete